MTTGNTKDSEVSFMRRKAGITLIVVLSIIILILTTLVWNGRYKAGFNAGESIGAEYKPYKQLYKNLEKTVPTYQKKIENNRQEIKRLTRKNAQLETRRGWLEKRSSEIDIEDMREQLQKRLDAVEQREATINQESEHIGELRNQAQQSEIIISDLKDERKNDRNLIKQLIFVSVIELVIIVALLGYIFFRTNKVFPPGYSQGQSPDGPTTININSREDSAPKTLSQSQKSPKGLLPDS